ncbi:hypothetical protein [Altibacter sp.]|uniref:hypothetical protein n=1 Tax=Altibacter sp. TaxID=2024823 RepID=UPI000C8F8E81|nr:hypothetical protein [Altibacter sp.]MAP53945.1 hypothetical protein [Altibacter sp.]|tara:strand:+ start:651 stop:1346 length:696 start_codon:yes stop_codon:yes gene_type:complete
MVYRLLTFLFVLALSANVYSQNLETDVLYRILDKAIDTQEGLTEAQINSMSGSPYANDTFLTGTVYYDGKVAAENVLLRYNASSDQIEIKNPKVSIDRFGALLKNPSISASIFNEKYVFVPAQGDISERYYKVLYSGPDYKLYKKTTVEYIPSQVARTSYEKNEPAKFEQAHTYYLVSSNMTFTELGNSKSKILSALSDKKMEIKSYFKKYKPDTRNDSDLANLILYYDTL